VRKIDIDANDPAKTRRHIRQSRASVLNANLNKVPGTYPPAPTHRLVGVYSAGRACDRDLLLAAATGRTLLTSFLGREVARS